MNFDYWKCGIDRNQNQSKRNFWKLQRLRKKNKLYKELFFKLYKDCVWIIDKNGIIRKIYISTNENKLIVLIEVKI